MTSEKRRTRSALAPAGPAGAGAGSDAPAVGLATVSHGPYAEVLPVGGATVGEVRRRFRDRLDIDPAATAFVDGAEVGDDHVLGLDVHLAFVRRAGEKGRRA